MWLQGGGVCSNTIYVAEKVAEYRSNLVIYPCLGINFAFGIGHEVELCR